MSRTKQVSELLARRDKLLRQGIAISPEELCRDCPEHLEELKGEVRRLESMDALLNSGSAGPLSTINDSSGANCHHSTCPTVPGYEVLAELGRGGMGVVYRAKHLKLNRDVALKMIVSGDHAGTCEIDRFRSEAEAVARLQHPNIVQIYEVGEHDRRPFIAFEFLEGGSLDKQLLGTPWSPQQAAALIETLARAMHHAHERGIVHRDLKPANVLLSGENEFVPKITDFGLAKQLDKSTGQTGAGAVLGTPSYMAPEQARGDSHNIDRRSDVYSLGAILYELLTGRPPFRGASVTDTLFQVASQEPLPPRRLRPNVPRDLETVCLKCLHKSSDRRYVNALGLADDLCRFRKNEPILARPITLGERSAKWALRHPAAAALLGVLATTIVIGLIAGAWYTGHETWRANEAEQLRGEAERHAGFAKDQERIAKAEATAAQEARLQADERRRAAEETITDLYTTHGLVAADQGDPAQAALWFAYAARLAGIDANRESANRVRARTWMRQATIPVRVLPRTGVKPVRLDFHPAGRHLLTQSANNRCAIWDLDAEKSFSWVQEDVRCAAWDPAGRSVVLGMASGQVEIRRFPNGEVLHRLNHTGQIRALAISSDGRYLAMASHVVRVWNLETQEYATAEWKHSNPVVTLAFAQSGVRLVTACEDNKARVFAVSNDPAHRSPLFVVPHRWKPNNDCHPVCPIFINKESRLLTVPNSTTITLRDAEAGKFIEDIRSEVSTIDAMVSSPDGRYLVIGGYTGAQLLDISTPRVRRIDRLQGHRNDVWAASFSPDGSKLVTASDDRTCRIWAIPGKQPLGPPLPHQGNARAAVFSPTGSCVATAQEDGLVRIWMLPQRDPRNHDLPVDGQNYSFARLSRDGQYAISSGAAAWPKSPQATRVYEVASGKPTGFLLQGEGVITDADLAPGTTCAVTAHMNASRDKGHVQLWDWLTGQTKFKALHTSSVPRGVAFSPDGKFIVTICVKGEIYFINSADGKITSRQHHGAAAAIQNTYPSVSFSPDGGTILSWGPNETVRVWDAANGKPRDVQLEHQGICQDAAWSTDGRLVATASRDNTCRVWDISTGELLADPLIHPGMLFAVCFSPDSRHVLTGCRDGMARLWNWRTGTLVCKPFEHADEVFRTAFTSDGRWLVTASRDYTARVWEWHTGKPVAPTFRLSGHGWTASITPDDRYLVTGGQFSRVMQVFSLQDLIQPPDLALDDLCMLGEVITGCRIHQAGLSRLTGAEWVDRWLRLRQRHPEEFWPRWAHQFKSDEAIADALRMKILADIEKKRSAEAFAGVKEALNIKPTPSWATSLATKVFSERIYTAARESEWPTVADVLGQMQKLQPEDHWLWYQAACLYAYLGNKNEYDRACEELLGRFGATKDAKIARMTVKVFALSPHALEELTKPRELLNLAMTKDPAYVWTHAARGMLDYRSGRWDDAEIWLTKSLVAGPSEPFVKGPAYFLLAMTYKQKGRLDEARVAYAKGVASIEKEVPLLRNSSRTQWQDWIVVQIFRREAEAVLGVEPPPKAAKP